MSKHDGDGHAGYYGFFTTRHQRAESGTRLAVQWAWEAAAAIMYASQAGPRRTPTDPAMPGDADAGSDG